MSRRDTIIAAVLINTGLLAVLFVMALNPSDDPVMEKMDINKAFVEAYDSARPEPELTPITFVRDNTSDEVDNVLKDFAATVNADTFVHEDQKGTPSIRQEIAMNETVRKTTTPMTINEEQQYIEITVKSGDILGKIARANGTTVSAIKKVNNLTSDRLRIGQVLRVPLNTKKEQTQQQTASSTNIAKNDSLTGTAQYYIVESGDNPWKIAKKFHVSVNELLRLNNLDEARARNMKPGDRIRVQ
ncbi:MAG: LysM peptidoglycan-binding domain-containing protein [Chlamydiales bacterium]|nr:LysM peptidoglycan-binding domain-containing protein [Chlamydiales bacterium]